MNNETVPNVVYHIAAMGNWEEVIHEQFRLVRDSGLAAALKSIDDDIGITHVGFAGSLSIVMATAELYGVPVRVVRTSQNILHYETFAMLEVQWLAKAKKTDRPILYFHTKGVSNPGSPDKPKWRYVMNYYVIECWRENVQILSTNQFDAVGFNWLPHGEQHFSGNFWMARPEWICRLPDFASYHGMKNLVRYSCEMWIGAAQYCRAYSKGTTNQPTWNDNFPFEQFYPKRPSP